MQLARETSKAINGMLINYEAHAMDKEEMRGRLVESEHVRHLLYEEVRRMAGEITGLHANLRLSFENNSKLSMRYNSLADSVRHAGAEDYYAIQNLQEAVAKLEEDKKTDAMLHKIAMDSINMLHNRITKLERRCAGLKGSITKKQKIILQLRQAIHASGV